MAVVRIPTENTVLKEAGAITTFLGAHGIDYEQWAPDRPVAADATAETLLAAYGQEIDKLKARGGYRTADVIDVRPETPNLDAMLAKFSREHWHDEDEVRFIIEGRGLFHVHPPERPGLRDRGRSGRSHPGASRHAPLVRSLRRSSHPRDPAVPGYVGLDAALHRQRRRPGISARVPRALVRPAGRARVSARPALEGDPRRFSWISKGTTTPIAFVYDVLFPVRAPPSSTPPRAARSARPEYEVLLDQLRVEHHTDREAARTCTAVGRCARRRRV